MDDRLPHDERAQRVEDVAPHEDDSDVATQAGGGILSEGGSAVVRGTGDRTGNAQGLEEERVERDPSDPNSGEEDLATSPVDATPGLHDFTETVSEASDRDRR